MWTCPACGCRNIAADVPKCPMCSEEKAMPKATSGGASNGWEQQETEAQAPVAEAPAPTPADAPEAVEPEATEVAEEVVSGPVETSTTFDVASMTKPQLQDHAESLGLSTDGTKGDLVARLAGVAEPETPDADPQQVQP